MYKPLLVENEVQMVLSFCNLDRFDGTQRAGSAWKASYSLDQFGVHLLDGWPPTDGCKIVGFTFCVGIFRGQRIASGLVYQLLNSCRTKAASQLSPRNLYSSVNKFV